MNLNDVEIEIDPVILDRGREYLLSGCVRSLEKVSEQTYRAQVEGSELYEVLVQLDKSGAILSLECDCPYDFGPVCKHMAAVLLMIRNEGQFQPTGATGNVASNSAKSLNELLQIQSKERLIELILSMTADSEVVERRVQLHVSEGDGDEQLGECRDLIQSYIAAYSDHHGFVNYRSVGRAVEGAEVVAEKAREAADAEDWTQAVRMDFCVLEEMLDLLQAADDSDGTIGGVIEESLERLQEIASNAHQMPEQQMSVLFRMLLEESGDYRLNGWPDWQLTLLRCVSQMAVTTDLREEWEHHVARISSRQSGGSWSRDYFAEDVATMRYEFICNQKGDAEAAEFLQHHLHFPYFRKLAIQAALEQGRYDDAIRLAKEGEMADHARGLPGLVKQWKEFRYEACERGGRLEWQREIGKDLVQEGDYSYYKRIKDSYSTEEWRAVCVDILDSLERTDRYGEVYTRILVEESETERLLAYVKLRPDRIEAFHRHLIGEFRAEVIGLFQVHIESTATHASARTHYQNVCGIIRMLQQAGGREEALQITRLLLDKYPRKPAFREELMKVAHG